MGTDYLNTWLERKRLRLITPEPMVAKLSTLMLGSLNIFLYLFAWAANLDNVKSTILFVVALIMSMIRFYRWLITSRQNERIKELYIKEKENELKQLTK